MTSKSLSCEDDTNSAIVIQLTGETDRCPNKLHSSYITVYWLRKDDEKALFKEKLTFEDTYKFGLQNAKDIIAQGFDPKKTFIFSNLEYMGGAFLMNTWEFAKLVTFNQVRGAFGFNER